jgi:hypothetical protein
MTFTFQDKPLAADLLSNSQADLKGNFDYLQGALGGLGGTAKDHQIVFGNTNVTTSEGRHNSVGLIDHGVQSFPSDGLDSFWYSTGGNTFWRNSSVGPVQMTNATVPSAAANGYTFLPGGILLQWGNFTGSSSPITISYPIGFTTAYQVVVTSNNTNSLSVVTAVGNINFTVALNNPGGGITIRWFAIGTK